MAGEFIQKLLFYFITLNIELQQKAFQKLFKSLFDKVLTTILWMHRNGAMDFL